MQEFASRRLIYADSDGSEKELVLTVFMPFEKPSGGWKCEFTLNPPIYSASVSGVGVDFLHALIVGMRVVRICLETTPLWGRAHWQGMLNCGLPSTTDKPVKVSPAVPIVARENGYNPSVFGTRKLGYPDCAGVERETVFALHVPFQESEAWKCGFTFHSWPDTLVRYGVGADAIEATLDALASARVLFESKIPTGWAGSEDLLDCADFPVRSGREFLLLKS